MTLCFEVSADWMAACGLGTEATIFEVLERFEYRLPGGRVSVFYELRGRYAPWLVSDQRGKLID